MATGGSKVPSDAFDSSAELNRRVQHLAVALKDNRRAGLGLVGFLVMATLLLATLVIVGRTLYELERLPDRLVVGWLILPFVLGLFFRLFGVSVGLVWIEYVLCPTLPLGMLIGSVLRARFEQRRGPVFVKEESASQHIPKRW